MKTQHTPYSKLIVRGQDMAAEIAGLKSEKAELLAALEAVAALANDPAGSQYSLREVFGYGNINAQAEGIKARAAIAKAKGGQS